MQAFYTCFLKFCLALNSYKKNKIGAFQTASFLLYYNSYEHRSMA